MTKRQKELNPTLTDRLPEPVSDVLVLSPAQAAHMRQFGTLPDRYVVSTPPPPGLRLWGAR